MKTRYVLAVLVVSAVAAIGCGLSDLIGLGPGASTATLPPSATSAAGSNTPPSGAQVTYPAKVFHKDAAGDCLSNADGSPIACKPAGLDMLSVTATRPDPKGPVTINLELAGSGLKDLKRTSLWVLSYAFDLDRNVATGLRDVYPAQHHIGPDITLLYGEVNGSVRQLVKQYTAAGKESDADSSLATWSFPDDNHIQVVVSPSLIAVERFYLVGDIATNDMYDHFVENGYLTFPEGQAVPEGTVQQQPTAAAPSTATRPPSVAATALIAKAVMAQGVKGLNAPVGITSRFPSGQGEVHAVVLTSNAPKGTRVKANWIAVDVGRAASPNTRLGESELQVFGTQYVDFYFNPSGGRMVPGTYRVELYLNGKLDRNLDFSVAGEGTLVPPLPSPSPMPVGSCPRLPPAGSKPSGILTKITTAENVKGSELTPVNPTKVFGQNSVFYVVLEFKNAPANTKLTANWYVTDAGDAAPCNGTLAREPTDLTIAGSNTAYFNLTPDAKWPAGMYRVEISVNDALDSVVEFTVK